MNYSENAINVFKKLYFRKDKDGNLLENHPNQVFKRVGNFVAPQLHTVVNDKDWFDIFNKMMCEGYFRPCTPCLMNAGVQEKPQTAACFVSGVQDDLRSILDFDREAALVFASGSGIGVNFGVLREKGASLSSGGESSGPFAFLRKLAATGEAVKSGGRSRRAAGMAMFFDNHPDLIEFITLKNGKDQETLRSMNLSIAISDKFMNAVEKDSDWNLCGVVDGEVKSMRKAKDIFDLIATNAHKTGDPGVWFIDRANRDNGLIDQYGRVISTNPCGEITGLAWSACTLASINLAKFVHNKIFDWDKFNEITEAGICFLDFMIDKSGYPTEDYERMAKATRPLGLGIMGMADMLCLLDIPYDSDEAFGLCGNICKAMNHMAIATSVKLAEKFGSFPAFENNREGMTKVCQGFGVELKENEGLRNSSWTTIAPTGTISISCDCSPGMEPLFGICYTKNVVDSNEKWTFVNPIFEKMYKNESWYQEAITLIAKNHGSCQEINCVPLEVQDVWKVAHDIKWEDRIEMQSHLQKNISNAISSTINLPKLTTVQEIKDIYTLAWVKGLKGITVYRDGSLDAQPIEFEQKKKEIDIQCKGRPKIRDGRTYEVATGHGNVFITVNKDPNGKVFEIFNVGGKGGGVSAANLEAIGRLVSMALQKGISPKHISSQLVNISDGHFTWDRLHPDDEKSVPILSIPDAIGKVLERFYVKEPVNRIELVTKTGGEELVCPECNGPAIFKEGCLFCPSCGSHCG